uniref:Uncharacterized protein n=1 Tax=Anguilla anguilla TaxID=7936 RepID=A0A0E9VR28_ANGAN
MSNSTPWINEVNTRSTTSVLPETGQRNSVDLLAIDLRSSVVFNK